jgi:hypothetical protein
MDEVFHFIERTASLVQEMQQIAHRPASIPFGDIGCR